MIWEDERLGRLAAPILHEPDVQRVWSAMGKVVDTDVTIGCIQLGELQDKACTGRGVDSPLHVEVLETVLQRSDRLNAAHRQASPLARPPATPTFILAQDPPRPLKRW